MVYIFEILIAIIITILFIKNKKPKIIYLFYGYLFFIISVILQIPFKMLQISLNDYLPIFTFVSLPFLLVSIITILISEFTKYFAIKRFLKTRSYKNAILFGIGWVSLESINYFSVLIYSFIFAVFKFDFNYSNFLNPNLLFFSFIYFFITNLAITILVIFAIMKKNKLYLFLAIIYSILILFFLKSLGGMSQIFFTILTLIYSFYIIFRYKEFRKN